MERLHNVTAQEELLDCLHHNIIMVTEKKVDKKGYSHMDKHFVECATCKKILPIQRITREERYL